MTPGDEAAAGRGTAGDATARDAGPDDASTRLARLLDAARARIRPVPVDVARAIGELLARRPSLLAPDERDLLRASICALVARNADEAVRFGALFDAVWDPPPPPPPPPAKRATWQPPGLVATAMVLLTLAALLYVAISTPPGRRTPVDLGAGVHAVDAGVAAGATAEGPSLQPAPSQAGPYRHPFADQRGTLALADLAGLSGAVLLLVGGVRQLLLFKHRKAIAVQVAEQTRDRADAARADAAVRELDHAPPPWRPAVWSEPPPGTEAAGAILRRVCESLRSHALDGARTARATAEAAGLFTPLFRARRRWRRLTVLLDDEGGEHVWAGGFRALVATWQRQGVDLEVWRFDHDPRRLMALAGATSTSLRALARENARAPLLVLARDLDPRIGGGRWLRLLDSWSLAVWIDPDPRRRSARRPGERAAIDRVVAAGLHRFPMSAAGLAAAAEALVTGDPRARPRPPWPGLPDDQDPHVAAMLRRWRVAVSQKPDATWELVEQLRLTVDGVAGVFRSRADVQALLDDVRRLGGGRADRPGDRVGAGPLLFVEYPAAVQWLYGLLEHDPEAAAVNHEIADLLIEWEEAHPASSPHARAIAAVKVLWHRIKQDPTRARINALVALAGTEVHDYVEDYVSALSKATERGLIALDGGALDALRDGEARLFGDDRRLPVAALRRAQWRNTALVAAGLFAALCLWVGVGFEGTRVPVDGSWHDESLAAIDTPVEGYLQLPADGGPRDALLDGPPTAGDAKVQDDAGPSDGARDDAEGGGSGPGDGGVPHPGDGGVPDPGDGGVDGPMARDEDADIGRPDGGADTEPPPPPIGTNSGSGRKLPRPPVRDLRCAEQPQCLESGQCEQVGSRCRATTAAHCRASGRCKAHGQCTLGRGANRGSCVIGGAADCASADVCAVTGRCGFAGGRCVAIDDADCRRAANCRSEGLCWLDGESCRARSAADCVASSGCRSHGACVFDDGQCSATAETCRASVQCRKEGVCSLHRGECQVGTDADCRGSDRCRVDGRCSARGRQCVAAGDDDCADSGLCKNLGQCTARGGKCITTDREDCISAGLCAREARCTPIGGACRIYDGDCARSRLCGDDGRCATEQGRCVARTRQGCAESTGCKLYGLCEPVDGECRATDADCRRAKVCREEGQCSARFGRCVAARAEDCDNGSLCRDQGRCTPQDSVCKPTRPEHCTTSTGCRTQGACTLAGDVCAVGGDEDCRRAQICAAQGRCRAVAGRCER